ARSISYLISWDTSLAASATRSPSDWPSPADSGTSLRTIRPISLVCGPLPALPHGSRAPAFQLLLGARTCSAKSKASVVVRERSAPRTGTAFQVPCCGPEGSTAPRRRAYRQAGRSGGPGPIDGTRMLWHLHPCVAFRRIITSQPHTDARPETEPTGTGRKAGG